MLVLVHFYFPTCGHIGNHNISMRRKEGESRQSPGKMKIVKHDRKFLQNTSFFQET